MRLQRPLAAVSLVALALTTAACNSKSAPSTAPTSAGATTASAAAGASAPAVSATAANAPAASAAPAAPAVASGSGSVTFDGAYSGTFTAVVCIGSGPTTTAHFNVSFTGDSGTSYTGDLSPSEFGFRAPDGTDFDSGFLTKPLGTDGKKFVLDGVVVKDEQSGKSVTTHGTLVCP